MDRQQQMDTSLIDPPCQNPSIDMHDPPGEDSPRHMLNMLNNYCIQAIFERINDVRDYHSAANVCTLFQANAIKCFPVRFKDLVIEDDDALLAIRGPSIEIPLSAAKNYLKILGAQIQSLSWCCQTNGNDVLNTIAEYCGKTLLSLRSEYPHTNWTNILPHLTALEKLDVEISNLTNFELHLPLKHLRLVFGMRPDPVNAWFIQNFPQLESFTLNFMKNLTNDMVIDFLNLNPQLRCLKIHYCFKVGTDIFNDIGRRLPHLEEIGFESNSNITFDENIRQLRHLKKLKSLSLAANVPVDEVMQLLVENQIPIEQLAIDGINDNLANAPAIEGLIKLSVCSLSDEDLLSVVNKHPNLQDLHVTKTSAITIDGVKKALESGKNLLVLTFFVNHFDVNEESYKSVLALAKNRVRVLITINTGTVTVPSDIIAANFKWLGLHILRPIPPKQPRT